MATEPISVTEPNLTFWQKHIQGKEYIEFHKEPLVVVADTANEEYRTALRGIASKEYVGNTLFLKQLIEKRREVCERRLQASKTSSNTKLRDEFLSWEAEMFYCDIALDEMDGKGSETKILRGVTRSIAGEIILLDREATVNRKLEFSNSGIGTVQFENRVKELVKIADAFTTLPQAA